MNPKTPILVGLGQVVARGPLEPERMKPPVELAAEAARRALADARAEADLSPLVDTLGVIRLFEHSVRGASLWSNPFGGSDNVPGSVARRVGLEPRRALYGDVGGHTPQRLLNRLAEEIFSGEAEVALLCGGEALGAVREAVRRGIPLDWAEEVGGPWEDLWSDEPLVGEQERRHGLYVPMHVYALFEQARRHELGLGLAGYRASVARWLAPFSAVAAANPFAQFPVEHSPDFLAAPSPQNPLLCEPYTRWMVAQDAVNQGAAVVMTSVGRARDLGIPEDRWVFLESYADADEAPVLQRPRLAASPAQGRTLEAALEGAGLAFSQVDHVDLYSCFPIAVSAACEALGRDPSEGRPPTVTGGLPFFGGPGNNYSLHAVAEVAGRIRRDRSSRGLVAANGGYLSKHSVGIYTGALRGDWKPRPGGNAQARAGEGPSVRVVAEAHGEARLETCAAVYGREGPAQGFVVGRLEAGGARFVARVDPADAATLAALFRDDVVGLPGKVAHREGLNTFSAAG